jgi:thiamine-monophosphate kinase
MASEPAARNRNGAGPRRPLLLPTSKLGDLGEDAILSDIILPRLSLTDAGVGDIGDDCTEIRRPGDGTVILATTDPCPMPLVFELEDPDFAHYGRMTMVVNVSDIAAMGGAPIGILISTVMPNSMTVHDYQRFLHGLSEAADGWSCPVLGGNIKDGPEFTATGTAIGSVRADRILRRSGGRDADKICVVGNMGLFWAAVLQKLKGRTRAVSASSADQLDEALYRPMPRIREAQILSDSALVTSCIDASDGVGAALAKLARINDLDAIVDPASLMPEQAAIEVAESLELDPVKLSLSWGNWELVLTVPSGGVSELAELSRTHDFPFTVVGEMRRGTGRVCLSTDPRRSVMGFASERFSRTSYFTYGIESYVDWLLNAPLVAEAADD